MKQKSLDGIGNLANQFVQNKLPLSKIRLKTFHFHENEIHMIAGIVGFVENKPVIFIAPATEYRKEFVLFTKRFDRKQMLNNILAILSDILF